MQIEVDFDVWKALTAKRLGETHTYNDVLRELIGLPDPAMSSVASARLGPVTSAGRTLGSRFLPNGTRLRARYKGEVFNAEIAAGKLVDANGATHKSASAAAGAITGTNVNGLLFWEVKRPSDDDWQKLIALQKLS